MKHISYLSKSFVCRLGFLSVFAAAIIVSASGYGQDYRRRGPLMTTNPAPSYTSQPQTQPQQFTPPASGIQNPTQINGTTQSMPTQTTIVNPNAVNPNGGVVPTAPGNPFTGVSANPFQPTPSTGYGYGPNVAPSQPIIQRNPFQAQPSAARPIQAATIGGQISTQPIARPFDNQQPQSPYSPYMYLYTGRNGRGGDNYNLYVRPMMEQQEYNRQMVSQVESLQQTIQRQQQQIQQQNRTLNQLQQEGIIPTQANPTIDTNPNSAQQYFNQQYQQYFNQQNR